MYSILICSDCVSLLEVIDISYLTFEFQITKRKEPSNAMNIKRRHMIIHSSTKFPTKRCLTQLFFFTFSSNRNLKWPWNKVYMNMVKFNYIIVQAWGLSSLKREAKASSDATATEYTAGVWKKVWTPLVASLLYAS